MPSGDGGLITRPCALGFSGNYPRALDGLARLLSLDMRVIDPAWIGMKLRKLLNVGEPLGHFMAPVPGERRQQVWPSTVAYVARLMIHRYAMLGVLDEQGFPLREMGILQAPKARKAAAGESHRADGRRALPGMRQQHADPQGRLRFLHRLRLRGGVRLTGQSGRLQPGLVSRPPTRCAAPPCPTGCTSAPRAPAPGGCASRR